MTIRRNRPIELQDAPEHRAIPIERVEVRDDSDDSNILNLEGYASTHEPYEMYGGPANGGWIEQMGGEAFDKTLREKPDLHLLINHAGMPLARTKSGTLQLSHDSGGLKVNAQLDKRDPEVQALGVKMARGDMDEMSFAFRVKGQTWEATPEFEDDPQALRTITEVSLHKGDVSVVNWGANPTTSAEVKSANELLRALVELDESELAEVRSDDDLLARARIMFDALTIKAPAEVGEGEGIIEDNAGADEALAEVISADEVSEPDTTNEELTSSVPEIVFARTLADGSVVPLDAEEVERLGLTESVAAAVVAVREAEPEVITLESLSAKIDSLTEIIGLVVDAGIGEGREETDPVDAVDAIVEPAVEEDSAEPRGMSLRLARALEED